LQTTILAISLSLEKPRRSQRWFMPSRRLRACPAVKNVPATPPGTGTGHRVSLGKAGTSACQRRGPAHRGAGQEPNDAINFLRFTAVAPAQLLE